MDKAGALDLMEEVWKYVTPGIMGVNKSKMLSKGVAAFVRSKGLDIASDISEIPAEKFRRPGIEELAEFLVYQLERDRPVAFLNLNAGNLRNLDSWHWVMIVGVEIEGSHLRAEIYDQGSRKIIDLGLWLETTGAGGGFVSVGAVI